MNRKGQGGILMTLLFLSMAPAGFIGCGGNRPDPVAVSDEDLATLRQEVRSILRPGCGSCHTTGLPTAKPDAIAAFDFRDEAWSSPMTIEELEGLASRSKELGEVPRSKIELLVGAEIARREMDI